MKTALGQRVLWLASVGVLVSSGSVVSAAAPTIEQALSFVPVQAGVDYDRPKPDDIAKCKVRATEGNKGWLVEGPSGTTIRVFLDTSSRGAVDQWSYFKDGLEVYRDIDANGNKKPDQYRWFDTAGSRWGVDPKETGVVESWKTISAEEVSEEVVAAIANQDSARFARLVLTPAELKSLGLGKERAEGVAAKASKAVAGFKEMASQQKTISRDSTWVQFSAGRPGIVPAGTEGSTKDLLAYENATAIVETGGKHGQVQIGTLIQVGDVWRIIDLPQVMAEGQADASPSGFFFQAAGHREEQGGAGPSDVIQKLQGDLEAVDREIAKATTPEEQTKLMAKRIDLVQQIFESTKTADDRVVWLRQLADTIRAAVQAGTCPDGVDRLAALFDKLQKDSADKNLAAYVKFCQLTAAHELSIQTPKADFAKIQSEWQKTLEQFVSDYPTAPDASEAMLQLGIGQEFQGQDEDAKKWYGRTVKEFPDSPAAKKAAGAQNRLDAVGKFLNFSGQGLTGGAVELAKFKGKVVLIQYWATWCEPAKADMPMLKELVGKYGKSFAVIGVNLDENAEDLKAYLAENPLPWPQIHEKGGLDSRPANILGILTLPTTILVDQQGKVISRNIAVTDVEKELKKLAK
jgi:thiol-disulfide isomerase/thioredoxin